MRVEVFPDRTGIAYYSVLRGNILTSSRNPSTPLLGRGDVLYSVLVRVVVLYLTPCTYRGIRIRCSNTEQPASTENLLASNLQMAPRWRTRGISQRHGRFWKFLLSPAFEPILLCGANPTSAAPHTLQLLLCTEYDLSSVKLLFSLHGHNWQQTAVSFGGATGHIRRNCEAAIASSTYFRPNGKADKQRQATQQQSHAYS